MRIFLTFILLLVMVSNTLVEWSYDFFSDMEKIEISKLADGEGENEKEDKKEETEKKDKNKIDASTFASNHYIFSLHKNAWLVGIISSMRYQEIVTPPPELS